MTVEAEGITIIGGEIIIIITDMVATSDPDMTIQMRDHEIGMATTMITQTTMGLRQNKEEETEVEMNAIVQKKAVHPTIMIKTATSLHQRTSQTLVCLVLWPKMKVAVAMSTRESCSSFGNLPKLELPTHNGDSIYSRERI